MSDTPQPQHRADTLAATVRDGMDAADDAELDEAIGEMNAWHERAPELLAETERLRADLVRMAEKKDRWQRESHGLREALRWYDDHKRPDGSYDGEMWGDLHSLVESLEARALAGGQADKEPNRVLTDAADDEGLRAMGAPVRCCPEWPECSHMLAFIEGQADKEPTTCGDDSHGHDGFGCAVIE